jgi:hypothetical protein
MELLFPIFLEDESEYDQAVNFWRELFADLLADTELEYKAYLNTTTVNGISLRDGNPIFDAFFPKLNKAVRIIQEEAEGDDALDIGAWLDETELESVPDVIQELVISLVLTEETLSLAKRMIDKWVIRDIALEKMKDYIDELIITE